MNYRRGDAFPTQSSNNKELWPPARPRSKKGQRGNASLLLLIITLGLALSLGIIVDSTHAQNRNTHETPYLPGEIWIKLEPDIALEETSLLLEGPNVTMEPGIPQLGWVRAIVPEGQESDYLARMLAHPSVQNAELNYLAHILDLPNDPEYYLQWNMELIGAPEAWDIITSTASVVIAIVDSGIEIDHPDLQANIWINTDEVPDNGLDDDGNGKIDDLYGWNFVHENNAVQDTLGHGTHVAGIAAAATNNAIGVAGVSWSGTVMPVRVFSGREGTYADIAQGVTYAADNGARIINLSFGGTAPSALLYDALHHARGKGCLIVAAAGNCGSPGSIYDPDCDYTQNPVIYPAAYPETVAVAATDAIDERCEFSEYHDYVDLSAPGSFIYSTYLRGDYEYSPGTSMSAPHVSGVAALIWALRPKLSSQEVQRIMESWAEDVNSGEYPGKDPYLGWGRINAYQAVLNASRGTTITLASSHSTLAVGPAQSIVTATMTTEYGFGPDGTPITFTTTLGYLSPPTSVLQNGTATTTLTAGTTSGDAEITAEAGGVNRTLSVSISPGEPDSITVTCDPTWISVDYGASAVTVMITDRFGNTVQDGTVVTMATSLGSIFPPTGLTFQGEVNALLTAQGGAGRARVTAATSSALGWTEILLYDYLVPLPIIQKEAQ